MSVEPWLGCRHWAGWRRSPNQASLWTCSPGSLSSAKPSPPSLPSTACVPSRDKLLHCLSMGLPPHLAVGTQRRGRVSFPSYSPVPKLRTWHRADSQMLEKGGWQVVPCPLRKPKTQSSQRPLPGADGGQSEEGRFTQGSCHAAELAVTPYRGKLSSPSPDKLAVPAGGEPRSTRRCWMEILVRQASLGRSWPQGSTGDVLPPQCLSVRAQLASPCPGPASSPLSPSFSCLLSLGPPAQYPSQRLAPNKGLQT